MNVPTILNQFLPHILGNMHKRRQAAIYAATLSAMKAQHVTITGLGRGIKNHVHTKHNVKRMDRLMNNSHLIRQRISCYRQLAYQLLNKVKYPYILVDASYLNDRREWLTCRAAVVVGGRALPIYDAVHPKSADNNPHMLQSFLETLREILPPGARPVLITDAGFRATWFKKVQAMGWYWLGRIRNRTLFQSSQGCWLRCKTLYEQATHMPQSLGQLNFTQANPITGFGCLYKQRRKGRMAKNLDGSRRISGTNKPCAKREAEPWLLVGHLPPHMMSAQSMVGIYRLRMQIEEGLRDGKSGPLGLGLKYSRTRSKHRFEVLLLINALALWACFWIGKIAYIKGWHRHFQANTVSHKRVLSYIYLGRELVDHPAYQLTRAMYLKALDEIVQAQQCWSDLS